MSDGEAYYEAEILKNVIGAHAAIVWHVDGEERRKVGDTRASLMGGWMATRDAAIRAATDMARRDRAGADVVRLDLDAR
jgi:hypothetical protein